MKTVGRIVAFGKDGESNAGINIREHGGHVGAYGNGKSKSLLGIDEYGGFVGVLGKDGESGAALGVPDENGNIPDANSNGAVFSWDKDGYVQ